MGRNAGAEPCLEYQTVCMQSVFVVQYSGACHVMILTQTCSDCIT